MMDGPSAATSPNAPGREIDLEDHEGGVRVSLRDRMKLDRDLVIRWTAAQQEIGVRLVEGKGLPGDDGRYVLITLTPPAAVREGLARDLTILIDASGSMSGIPISRAKIVAEELLRSLDPEDRFEILAFSNDVKRLVGGPKEASAKRIREALTALGRLEAGGATEMTRAMVEALKPLRPDSQRQVILISDGYIGFEGEVIGEIHRRLVPAARLHAVGVGSAPNRSLTRGAARAGRGVEILVGDDDRRPRGFAPASAGDRAAGSDGPGGRRAGACRARARKAAGCLQGQPLVLLAEIAATGGALRIQGKQEARRQPGSTRWKIPAAGESARTAVQGPGNAGVTTLPLGALFGREAIEDVELELAAVHHGRGKEGDREPDRSSRGLRHESQEKTSLVAIQDSHRRPEDPRRRERLAVEVPAEGLSAEGVGSMRPRCICCRSQKSRFTEILFDVRRNRASDRSSGTRLAAWKNLPSLARPRTRQCGKSCAQGAIRGARVLHPRTARSHLRLRGAENRILLPIDGTQVHVCFDDGSDCRAEGFRRRTSTPGPHRAGLTVRLGGHRLGLVGRQGGAARSQRPSRTLGRRG